MNSFKNVRELLLLSYVNNVFSDREFVLLYDAYHGPKIPTLITSNMTRSISITSIQPNVKQSSADPPPLAEALQLPPTFRCQQRTVFDSTEGLCMLLKRVSYPCRYSDMIP